MGLWGSVEGFWVGRDYSGLLYRVISCNLNSPCKKNTKGVTREGYVMMEAETEMI